MTLSLNNSKQLISPKSIVLTLFLASFILVVYRAFTLSFTHDEAISYKIIFGHIGYRGTANNHYLNSYLMRLSFDFFGDSQFAFRLPNVLSYLIYLAVWYKIILKSENWALVFFGVSIVLLNPFVLDYFSLARGYGLSVGFIMASIYFLIQKTESGWEFIRSSFGTLLFAILAMYASFATTNFFIATVAVLFLKFVLDFRQIKPTKIQIVTFFLLLTISTFAFWFAYLRLNYLQKNMELYFGADNIRASVNGLFLSSTILIKTLGNGLLYLSYIFVVMLLIACFIGKFRSDLARIALLFFLIIVGHFLENRFFGALFPIERAAIYIYPLINLIVILGLFKLFSKIKSANQKRTLSVVLSVLTVLVIYNFGKSLNVHATRTWDYDQHTQYVAEYLEGKTSKQERISISNHWLFEPSLNYYFASREMNITPAKTEVDDTSQYVYTYTKEIKRKDFTIIKEFKELGIGFYERKKT